MCLEIENLAKNLHLISLPSTLWGIHIDPNYQFIAILHLDPLNFSKLTINKGILLTFEENLISASVSLNNEIVDIPSTSSKITTVSDLSLLLYMVNSIRLCLNFSKTDEFPKCAKHILNDNNADFCYSCLFEDNTFDDSQDFRKETECYTTQEPINYFEVLNKASECFQSDNEDFSKIHLRKTDKNLCNICGKTFTSNSSIKEHMLTHSDKNLYECKVCSKSFAKKYNLNVHLRVHSGERPYICSKCGKTYTTRSNLSTHTMSAHSKEKKHRCEFCEMSFVHPRVLRIHMRTHTGEKPFMCQVCGKVFSKNIHLTVHTRTHTGEKPHICPICGKGFTTTGNLSSHKRINHKDFG